jgi:hypothetical protein
MMILLILNNLVNPVKRTLELSIQKNKSGVKPLPQTTAKFSTATKKATSSQIAVYNGERHK